MNTLKDKVGSAKKFVSAFKNPLNVLTDMISDTLTKLFNSELMKCIQKTASNASIGLAAAGRN